MPIRSRPRLTRRGFLKAGASLAAVTALPGVARPYLSRAADRPLITHGLQSGDVTIDSGMIWARSDRPSRMLVEVALTESFKDTHAAFFVDALPESDFTAKALIEDLPPGQDVFYRVRFQDHAAPTIMGEAQTGHFRTAPAENRSISFLWSGDTAGQGWGIDETRGGMRAYATMLRNAPDFFIHCGDSIYADCPIPAELKLPDGSLWRNLVTEDKSTVAETLSQFRGNYKYNLLDRHVRAFNAAVPMLAQWDDHEVANDWSPAGFKDTGGLLGLSARAGRAFHEFMPIRQTLAEAGRIYRRIGYGPLLDVFLIDMRSYRGPNTPDATDLLGQTQLRWLKRELARSRAVWKVIAADLPIGLISEDAIARGDGPPRGRENEIADLLSFLNRAGVHNVVWLTADMHYTAAHHYNPGRAMFQDFEPFWEFVSGPLHAGTWGPAPLDNTFGPKVAFQKGCRPEQGENLAPCFGLQFFGRVDIDGESATMTVTLKDVADQDLWSVEIAPRPPGRPVASAF